LATSAGDHSSVDCQGCAIDIHSNAGAGEIRISHLIIVDNHGKVLGDEQGGDGEVYITRYATEQTIYR
jgi:hypothetical protein